MSVKFPAEIYAKFRPYYPAGLFDLLRSQTEQTGLNRAGRALWAADIGCGTGQSTVGLSKAGLFQKVFAVEPDATMLAIAKNRIEFHSWDGARFVQRRGEETGFPDRSVDVVFCASAFHWFDRERAVNEFLRILKRPGLVFLAEYSFPKSSSNPKFDEWIQHKFSTDWQIPELANRESFSDMVKVFAEREGVKPLGTTSVEMHQQMSPSEIVGLIRSQSRYVSRLAKLPDDESRMLFDMGTEATVQSLFTSPSDTYDFRLMAAGFAVQD